MQGEALCSKHFLHAFHLQLNHFTNLFLRQSVESDDVINAVKELGTHQLRELFACCVARHDDDRVLEIHQTTFVVRQPSVVKHLQQGVEHIGMGFLYLIEKHHTIRLTAHSFG